MITRQERGEIAQRLAQVTDASPEVCTELLARFHRQNGPQEMRDLAKRMALAAAPPTYMPLCPACFLAGVEARLLCKVPAHRHLHNALSRFEKKRRAAAPAPPAEPAPAPSGDMLLDRVDLEDVVRQCSSKKRYGDPALAAKVAGRCYEERGHRLRVYPCTICGGFHLTHHATPPPGLAAV